MTTRDRLITTWVEYRRARIPDSELANIMKLSLLATPGPYHADWGNRTLEYRDQDNHRGFLWEPDEDTKLNTYEIENNLAYAEALEPETVLELVREILQWRNMHDQQIAKQGK